jgi:hypothetical protein
MKKQSMLPSGTPPPEPDLCDMDAFHCSTSSGRLTEIIERLAGTNVLPFRRRGPGSDGGDGPGQRS